MNGMLLEFGALHETDGMEHVFLIFPLPRLTWGPRLNDPAQELRQRVDHSLKSLNDLASVPSFPNSANEHLPLTAVQQWAMADIWRRVERHGAQPTEMDEDSALANMLSSTNLYTQKAARLVPTDRILQRSLQLIPVEKLLPPEAAVYIHHHEDLISKSSVELEAEQESFDPITPYRDPGLKTDFGRRLDLYRALHSAGLLCFRRRRKARVAFFTVSKKDGVQRLLVDARDANQKQRRPPFTRLSTTTAFGELDLDPFAQNGVGEVVEARVPGMSAGDVGDCFYNFSIEPLSLVLH